MKTTQFLVILAWTALAAGCGDPPPSQKSSGAAPPPPAPQANATAPSNERNAEPGELRELEVGMGKKGRGYGGGVYTEPLRVRWRAEEQIILANLKNAMKIYKATHGSLPDSHEAFFEKIIKPNQIKLPELPDNEEYIYVPEREELMRRRKQAP